MQKKTFIFTVLLSGLSTLLFGQPLVFSPTTIPDGLYGSAYTNQALTVTGGTAPYSFSVSGGSLPQGMSLSTDGILSGTPTAAGTYLFTITALDNSVAPGPFSGSQAYSLVVDQAILTITAGSASMAYGGVFPVLGFSYSGFTNGDNSSSLSIQPSLALPANASSPVGSYTATPSGAADPNYMINYVNGTLTITPVALTITGNNSSMTYGGSVPSLSASYAGFVNGDNSASLTTQPTITTAATSSSPAGTYSITATGAVDPNYTITYQPGTMTVGKAPLTVTADNKSMPLGGPLPILTISYTGFVNGDIASSLTTQPTATTTATAGSPAGVYTITPGGGVSSNYTLSYVNGTLAVATAVLTITANPATSVYGAALVPPGSLTVTYSGFVNGDGPGSMTALPIVSNTAVAGSPVGSYTLTPSGAANPNYTIQYVNGNYTISPAAMTITANNASMTYGGVVPSLTVTYSGFVNGDNSASLTTQPTATTTATAASPAGTYPITASGAVDLNYTITYQAGTMTVGKAPLTVTAANKSMPLGGPLPILTISYTGFVNGDNASSLTTQPTATTTATAASPAGVYPITPGGGVSSNYTFSYANGTLAVATAVLTITANPATSVYGAALVPPGSLTVTYSGFVNGDGPGSMTALPTVSNAAVAGSPAGSYTLTPSGAANPNYVIQYVNGNYTIAPAALNVTAVSQTMTYGTVVPALTVTYSGFVNGDNSASLTIKPTLSTTASSTTPTGVYPITASGAVDPNYTITYQAGTMTVGKAPLTVTAANKSMPLGGPLPILTISYSGFVNADNASSLTTQPTATTTATAASPAGVYPITPGGGVSSNYTFGYVNGTLAVATAVLTITANPATSVYGAALVPPGSLTVSYSGFLNGDGPGSMTALPIVSNAAVAGSPVGSYTLTPSGAANPNYAIQYVNGNYTITPAALNVTAVSQTMTYGTVVPALTVTYSGFVNGDNASSLTIKPTLSTTASSTSPTGVYPITASGAVDPNYTIIYQAGSMTVGKALLTVTADNKSMPLGGPLPILTISYTGFVNADNASSLTTQPTVTTTATAASPAGVYPITPGGGASSNYTFSYVNGTLAVATAVLTITANPATSVYGAPLVAPGSLTVSYSGFLNGDGPGNMTALPIVSNTAVASSPVGSYKLVPSGAANPNYVIQYVNGNYTISPATLNVAANSQTMTYGGLVPSLSASYTGFVNGDNSSSLTTQPTITTTATSFSPAGTYPVNTSGAADPNYIINYQTGTMTVGRATLTVTPDNKSMPLGGPLPILTISYSGFVNGDNTNSLSTLPTANTTATASSAAGVYPITASGAIAPNYSFVYAPGTLTIGSAILHVTANAETKEYGAADPTFTYTVTGFLNGDNTSIFTGSLSRASGENVGTYPITIGSLNAGSNYTISFTGNHLTITKASQQITWGQSLLVGCNDTTHVQLNATATSGLPVTYSVSASGADVATVSGNVLELLKPGTAVVTAAQAGDSNYDAAPDLSDTVFYKSATLISQHWNDVIFFDNTSGDYVQWQWYKNDSAVKGDTAAYYSETPSLNGQYFVIATNKDGQQVQSCTLAITAGVAIPGGIKVFPNPVNTGGVVTITCNYSSAALQGALLQIVDLSGRVLQQLTNIQPSMQVTAPAANGIYIINLLLTNGQKVSINVLVGG